MKRGAFAVAWLIALGLRQALAQTTPGYPERVLQWVVQDGQTCPEIATSLYGAPAHEALLSRYNELDCRLPLTPGRVLVVPESTREPPLALLEHATPAVQARSPDGDWSPAAPGLSLYRRYGVNTLEDGTADIVFGDRSRVFLAEHTLIVIYQTAQSSQPRHQDPLTVELDTGELQAGIAALRGRDRTALTTTGGGRVEAASRDTVLRRSGDRTTVSVFDGSAAVASLGSTVQVPSAHGTSFRSTTPPAPPRPLPPAPTWTRVPPRLVMAPAGRGTLTASWAPVANAKAYRVELAHDREFHQPVVRQEVPADVTSLRAEALPSALLYLRIRSIDNEDFLGLSSTVQEVVLVTARIDLGTLDDDVIRASPYAVLELEPGPELELSIDDRPFASGSRRLDLLSFPAERLSFRRLDGQPIATVSIRYARPEPDIGALRRGLGQLDVTVQPRLPLAEAKRAGLRLWLRQAGERREIALTRGPSVDRLTALVEGLDDHQPCVLELSDSRGVVLGRRSVAALPAPPAPPAAPPSLAPDVVLVDLSPESNYEWWEPRARTSASAGVTAALTDPSAQAWFSASRAFGAFGVFGRVVSDLFAPGPGSDNSAWLGARLALSGQRLQTGVGLRAALPVSTRSPPARLEPSFAAGSELGRGSLLLNLGSRLSLEPPTEQAPRWQVFSVAGATYRIPRFAMLHGTLDASVGSGAERWCGGSSFGIGSTGRLAIALSARLSPCSDLGWATLQAALSIHAP